MEDARSYGVRGSRPGHMGRMTHFYSQVKNRNVNRNQIQELLHTFQDVIMEHFGLQLVTETYEEGVDFIRAQK